MIPPKEFIRKIQPFTFLAEDELDIILSALEVILFEKGKTIYKKGQASPFIYVVFSGLVGLFDDEAAVDCFSRGEIFEVLCVHGFPSNYTAKAIEDSICYGLLIEQFRRVFDNNPQFSSFLTTFVNKQFESFRTIAIDRKVLEEASFVLEVAKIIYKDPVVCGSNANIADAVLEMEKNHVSSIVVVDDNKRAVGILTHKDLRRVILQGGRSDGIATFMSTPVRTIAATGTVFDAFTTMIDAGIDHLVVVGKDGGVIGVVTRKDIQVHLEPSFSIIKLFRKVTRATTIAELETILNTLKWSVAKIAITGPRFYDLTRMICSVHDAMVVRTIEILSGGQAKDQFAWLHMGSSGRREEIIATDQDNALIFRGDDGGAWAVDVNEALARIGFPKCPGDYMASNPMWSQTVSVWKECFRQWFADPIPEHVRYLSVFLDMRPVYGDKTLHEELLEAIRPVVSDPALRLLAYDAVALEPPLGISGIVRLHTGVDLKTYGIYPIVNGTRVLAVDNRMLETTNTRDRLEALHANGIIDDDLCQGLQESYGFLQDLRLRQHARAVLSQTELNNVVSAKDISKVDLLLLKESLKIVASFQKFLMKKYDVQRIVTYSQL